VTRRERVTSKGTTGHEPERVAFVRSFVTLPLFAALAACAAPPGVVTDDNRVLRVVPQADLEILDTVWSTAATTRNHGYMIYDTLFGMDSRGAIAPQMVDAYDVSSDRKTWTFTLRPGLEFHDGTTVTSDDVIASLQRWTQRDSMGLVMRSFVERWEVVDTNTFRILLKEPYGLMLETLSKTVGSAPFIMPKRVAATPPDRQIDDQTGSGPFMFKRDEWRPGEKIVYIKNARYKARAETPDGSAGGKVAKLDRVEWVVIKDPHTQASALAAGEVDLIELPPFEQYSFFKADRGIQLVELNPLGFQIFLRFNHLGPPFDNPKVRQAAMAALNQPEFLKILVNSPDLYRVCFSVFPCGTSYFTTKGMDFIASPDPARARRLLQESGYDGTPVLIMQPADQAILARIPLVAAQMLRQIGFKVIVESMHYNALLSRRATRHGWSVFITFSYLAQQMDPVVNLSLSGACEKAWFGWPCDPDLEKLRGDFARAEDEKERRSIAERIQVRAMEIGAVVPLGEYSAYVAARKSVNGFVPALGGLVLWNVEKN
jgi:peptide/nickel transport system substrate-binding protein